jgi:gas vesicle protein
MTIPRETRRLPKWIFVLGDIFLVGAAWVIESESAKPLTGTPIIGIVVCVALATVLFVVPFVADYARSQEEAYAERQNALQALAATVTASAEQISIAASGLDRLAGIAQENFNQSDRLAQQIREQMGGLHERLAEAKRDDGESAGRLEAVAKKIAQSVADLESARRRDGESAERLETVAKKIARSVADLEAASARAAEPVRVPAPPEVPPVLASQMVEIKPAVVPSGPPFVPPEPPAAAPSPGPAPSVPVAAAAPAEAPLPRRPRPRKPPPAADVPGDLLRETASAPAAPDAGGPPAPADGATRLVVTAYIGIGNRLFIRGNGPGLSWDRGVPLVFVSIGKWRWETSEAAAPVRFKLYKNDEIECTALGERSVDPGAQQNLTASF